MLPERGGQQSETGRFQSRQQVRGSWILAKEGSSQARSEQVWSLFPRSRLSRGGMEEDVILLRSSINTQHDVKKKRKEKEFLLPFLSSCDLGGKGGGRAVVLSVVGC